MRTLSAALLVSCASLFFAATAALAEDGVVSANAPQQDGRIAMTVRCPDACMLGARLLDNGEHALWVSLGSDDFGRVALETLDRGGNVVGEETLAEGSGPSPFPSAEPVYVEVARKGGSLSGWTQGRRLWGFGLRVEAELPEIGTWSVVHDDGATLSNVSFENAQTRSDAPPTTGEGFTAQKVDDLFYSETVSVGDFNADGVPDIVTGPRYYLGPDYSVSREIYGEETTNPNGYSSGMLSATDDFNGDGWDDVLILESGRDSGAHQAILYLNPKGENRHWDRSVALATTQGEASAYADIDGDGVGDLVLIRENTIGIAHPGADPREPWSYQPVSEEGEGRLNPHGVGVGDVDGDGRLDVLHASGWFKRPAKAGDPWVFTPVDFGPGAQLYVEDLNGDGLNDVVGSLDAHGWGLAWYEQTQAGGAAFERHLIMGDPAQTPPTEALRPFSEPHAVAFVDLNGDGLDDIVTGKRWWAHRNSYLDPDGQGPSVIYAFLQSRDGDAVSFTPHFVGDHVGVGNQIAVQDLDGDGKPEIIATARKGTVIYMNALR